MAHVAEDRGDNASLSSVPASVLDSESESEDVIATTSSQAVPAPITSAKAREAQCESARNGHTQSNQTPTDQSLTQPSTRQQAAVTAAVNLQQDPDEVPPPPYSEAMRQPSSRPDDGDRYAWRQGIARGSLDMSSLDRLLSPRNTGPPEQSGTDTGMALESTAQSAVPPQRQQDAEPLVGGDQARSGPDYGTITDHRHAEYRRDRRRRYEHDRHPDEPGSEPEPEPHDGRSDPGRRRHGNMRLRTRRPKRTCFNWRGDDPERLEPHWTETVEKRRRRRLALLLKIVGVLLMVLVTTKVVTMDWKKEVFAQPGAGRPGDDDGSRPELPGKPSRDRIIIPPSLVRPSKCPGARWGEYMAWSSSNEDVQIRESLGDTRLTGLIRLVKGDANQEHEIMASVAYATNPDTITQYTGFKMAGGWLGADDSMSGWARTWATACVDMDIIAFLRPGTSFKKISIETVHLGIEVEEGLFMDGSRQGLGVIGTTSLKTTSGGIKIPYLSSREINIRSLSGSIEGTFSLYDLLSIRSSSGAITADVDPKPALAEDPTHPAEFDVRSSSGTLKLAVNTHGTIPNRLYKTEVETQSSAISGTFIIGENAKFSSHSGSLEAELLPFIFTDTPDAEDLGLGFPRIPRLPEASFIPKMPAIPRLPKLPTGNPKVPALLPLPGSDLVHDPTTLPGQARIVRLQTGNIASATKLLIREPITADGGTSDISFVLQSTHESSSGRVELVYPASWSGTLRAHSTSGSLDVSGDRVEQVVARGRMPWDGIIGIGPGGTWLRRDRAGKVGESTADVRTVSGRVKVQFQ